MRAFRIDVAEGGLIFRELHPTKDRTERKMGLATNDKKAMKLLKKWIREMLKKK